MSEVDRFSDADHDRAERAAMASALRARADALEAKPEHVESAKVKAYRRGFWLWLVFSAAVVLFGGLVVHQWTWGATVGGLGFICAMIDAVKGANLAEAEREHPADA